MLSLDLSSVVRVLWLQSPSELRRHAGSEYMRKKNNVAEIYMMMICRKKYCRKGTTYTGLLRCSNMVSFEQGTIQYILSSLGVSL